MWTYAVGAENNSQPDVNQTAARGSRPRLTSCPAEHGPLFSSHLVGNAAIVRSLGDVATGGPASDDTPRNGVSRGAPVVISRLMSCVDFKDISKKRFGLRRDVGAIDRAVDDYHKLPLDGYGDRRASLRGLVKLCEGYLGDKENTSQKRHHGVEMLLRQASQELEIFHGLADASGGVGTRTEQFRALESAASSYQRALHLFGQHDFVGIRNINFQQLLQNKVREIEDNEPAALKNLISEDLDRLRGIVVANRDNPDITSNILSEVLANGQLIRYREGGPGTALLPKDADAKYLVRHRMAQPRGEVERLGALVHELTHVSSGETYRNTPLLLLFDPEASDHQIDGIVEHRRGRLVGLANLLEAQAAIDGTPFTAARCGLIEEKLNYGHADLLGRYVASFFEGGFIDNATKRRLLELCIRVENGPRGSNVLVEYDSVLNQILLYMQVWGIAYENPFYVSLRDAVTEAYEARRDFRARSSQRAS